MVKRGWKKFRDFHIKIEPTGDGRYRAEAQGPTGEALHEFDLPFDEKDLTIFLLKVGRPRATSTRGRVPEPLEPTQKFGKQLYQTVFSREVRDLYVGARLAAESAGEGLRLRLRLAGVPELADLPWEFLNDGRDFLALSGDSPLVRYLDLPSPPRPANVALPLRVLVTVSAPLDLPPLDVEAEKMHLTQSLERLISQGRIEVEFTPDATLKTLQRTLRQARSIGRPFHVWHYIGHGAFDERMQASVLSLTSEQGVSASVGGFQLGTLFDGYPEVRLVLLNACEGARSGVEDPFAGVASALVESGIPAVIAMQFEITDVAAITLAEEFYAALVDGLPIDAALTEARRAVFFLPNWVEWATPVLFLRAPDGILFEITDLPPAPPVPKPETQSVEKPVDIPLAKPQDVVADTLTETPPGTLSKTPTVRSAPAPQPEEQPAAEQEPPAPMISQEVEAASVQPVPVIEPEAESPVDVDQLARETSITEVERAVPPEVQEAEPAPDQVQEVAPTLVEQTPLPVEAAPVQPEPALAEGPATVVRPAASPLDSPKALPAWAIPAAVGALLLVVVIAFFALRGLNPPAEKVAVTIDGAVPGDNATATAASMTQQAVVAVSAADTATPTPTFTITPTPMPTLSPTPTIPVGIPFSQIKSITIDNVGRYIVQYETYEFIEALSGQHVHFFFDTVLPEQAGSPGSGQWVIWGGPRPFDRYSAADRPEYAAQLCILVANPDHSVQPDSGNCMVLPDVVAASPVKDLDCLAGPGEQFAGVASLSPGDVMLVRGVSDDNNWWNVINPQDPGSSCWLQDELSYIDGDPSNHLDLMTRFTENAILYYSFNEPSGSTEFKDSAGLDNNGSCSGMSCPTAGEPGYSGYAVRFDGSDDALIVANSEDFNLSMDEGLTVEAWIKLADTACGYCRIFSFYDWKSGYSFDLGDNIGHSYLTLYIEDGVNSLTTRSNVRVPLNEWHHVAAVFDRNESFVRLYIDGKETTYSKLPDVSDSGEVQSLVDALVGSLSTEENAFNGWIDELVIYKYALSSQEIGESYDR